MSTTKFATTRLAGLRAKGAAGNLQHGTIEAFLEQNLGKEHARLFADFGVRDSDTRDWFVQGLVKPTPLKDLSPKDQEHLEKLCGYRIGQIKELIRRLENGSLEMRRMAQMLDEALSFPNDGKNLWSLSGDPVVTNWGYHLAIEAPGIPPSIQAHIEIFKPELVKSPLKPPASSDVDVVAPLLPEKEKRNRAWLAPLLLWLVFIGLMGGIYHLLLPACGVKQTWALSSIPFLNRCPSPGTLDGAFANGRRLQREVEQAEISLARLQQDCDLDRARDRSRQAGVQSAPQPQASLPPELPRPNPVDQQMDERLKQNTAGRGRTEITLIWSNTADLDLRIQCPGGEELFRGKKVACSGEMIDDINREGTQLRNDPIEHAFWADSPPPGRYRINVELFRYHREPSGSMIQFTLRIKRGDDIQQIRGQIRGERRIETVHEVTF